MKTDPGVQQAFPWFEGQPELAPVLSALEPFGDYWGDDIHPEAIGLRVLAIYQPKRGH